jgi:radical SAM protein with 4Fe4S-binding SPASM domain
MRNEVFKLFKFLIEELKPDEWVLERPLYSGNAKNFWDRLELSDNESFEIISRILKIIKETEPDRPSRIYLDNFVDWYNPLETSNRYRFLYLPQFCREHSNYFFIAANGDVVLCPCAPIDDNYLGRVGNVVKDDIPTLWRKISKRRRYLSNKLKKCIKCKYLRICGSGCRIRAIQTTRDAFGCDTVLKKWLWFYEKDKSRMVA